MPYAFYPSPRESTSFPKSLFCLAGSLPRDRAPTLHPKPAAGLGELTRFPKVFPILLRSVSPCSLRCSPTSVGPYGQRRPPARVGAGGGGGWGGSSTAQIWCFRAPDQLPIGIAADPCNYRGKEIQQLVQNPKLLKGCLGLVGCPLGRARVGGWVRLWLG